MSSSGSRVAERPLVFSRPLPQAAVWIIPLATYAVLGCTLIAGGAGMQGDEAYLLEGAIRILRGDDLVQWMATPYHGSAKAYFLAPLFAAFGVSAAISRVFNLLLGAIGICGAGVFASRSFGERWGAVAMVLLAVHPGYVAAIVFDSTGVPLLMAGIGAVLIALARFLGQPDPRSTFYLGLALGLATWTRANFVWMNFGLLLALAALRIPPPPQWPRLLPRLILGGLIGGFPLIAYQIETGAGTVEYMRTFGGQTAVWELPERLRTLLGVLFYDAHRRYIWGGQSIEPRIETIALAGFFGAALVANLAGVPKASTVARRVIALWAAMAIPLTLSSRLPLGPHHFLAYVPLLLLGAVGFAAAILEAMKEKSGPEARIAFGAVSAVGAAFVAVSIWWLALSAAALHRSRGIDFWSDAGERLTAAVVARRAGRDVDILDWGPNFTIYVQTGGEIAPRSLFWNRSAEKAFSGETWEEVVRRGGLFVLISRDIAHDRISANAFLRALRRSGKEAAVTEILQANGNGYAKIYDVPAGPAPPLY